MFLDVKNRSFPAVTGRVDDESSGCIDWLQLRIWPGGINAVLKNNTA